MLEWIKSKISKKPIKTKKEILGEIERGDLVKVHLKPRTYFDRCYPGGTPRFDQELINEGFFIGNVVNCFWRPAEKIWIITISTGRRNGIREFLFLEDEIERIRKVNKNDL
jgi:hypothetical protein